MKWLLILGLVTGYFYMLTHTTDIVLKQTSQISHAYQSVAGL